jgi:hypothetical protein
MRGFLGFVSFALLVGGLQGLMHAVTGEWIPLMGFMRILYFAGYDLLVGIGLLVLGVAVGAAAEG